MNILLVEDDKKILNFVKKGFLENGFCVDSVCSGEEALEYMQHKKYHCVVLDIMLPQMNGYETLRCIRGDGNQVPVIFLTAKDSTQDKIKGLDLGADDYVVKPFVFSELLSRVNANIRRITGLKNDILKVGNIELDKIKRVVTIDNKKVELTQKEFHILNVLLENKNQIVTRTMLTEIVWGYSFDTMSNVLDVHINNLRTKINIDKSQDIICTIRGVGYVIKDS